MRIEFLKENIGGNIQHEGQPDIIREGLIVLEQRRFRAMHCFVGMRAEKFCTRLTPPLHDICERRQIGVAEFWVWTFELRRALDCNPGRLHLMEGECRNASNGPKQVNYFIVCLSAEANQMTP